MSDANDLKRERDQPPMFQSQSQSATGDTSFAKKPAAAGLLSGYQRSASTFDELLADDGKLRPHYARLIGALEAFSPADLQRRSDTSRRLILEQGITYNVYGDPRGMERPWQVDPIPLIIAPEEWRALAAGLIQRATLLNKILVDCYGAQDLIRTRWLSPALLPQHPRAQRHPAAFLRRRPRALAGRPVVGDLRPHADPHRRGLRAGEPARHLAHPAGTVP